MKKSLSKIERLEQRQLLQATPTPSSSTSMSVSNTPTPSPSSAPSSLLSPSMPLSPSAPSFTPSISSFTPTPSISVTPTSLPTFTVLASTNPSGTIVINQPWDALNTTQVYDVLFDPNNII